jgi:hypothetical protein
MMNPLDTPQRRGATCLSDFLLDRFRLGELEGAAESEHATTHLGDCEQCRARLAELEAVMAPAIDLGTAPAITPLRPSKRWPRRALWFAPLLAAAAIAVLVPWTKTGLRSKGGGWHLGVVAQHANGRVTRVSPGEALRPGDRLRFEVSAPTDAFVSVISLDAKGTVTPFVPATGDTAAIRAGKQQLLDGAVRLDDAMGPERILLLACPRPMAVAEVVAAGRAALGQAQGHPESIGQLELPCTQTSFWIRKEARP